jgi:hypothetical protein
MAAITDEELQELRALALERALEQRQEADRAGDIANRDERVVAGEDTEKAATAAANLAKQQLGGAAGRGAAALAGMMAAQKARDSEFSSLLQRARERKDRYEQLETERRQKAFGTMGQASAVEQTRLRDNELSDMISELQKERDALQNEGLASNKPSPTYATYDPNSNVSGEDTTWLKLESGKPIIVGGIVYNPNNPAYEEKFNELYDNKPQVIADTIDRMRTTTADVSPYKQLILESDTARKPELVRNYMKDAGLNDFSDANLKEIYKDAGNHAGKKGNAKKSAKIAISRAEKWLEDDGTGINELLIERFSR